MAKKQKSPEEEITKYKNHPGFEDKSLLPLAKNLQQSKTSRCAAVKMFEVHAFPKAHIKWPLIGGCYGKLKNQYLVLRMGAQLRMARVLTVIISDLMKTTGSLLLVELSRIVI